MISQLVSLVCTLIGDVLSALSRNAMVMSQQSRGSQVAYSGGGTGSGTGAGGGPRSPLTLVPVPYRNSKLTHLLKGTTHICMYIHTHLYIHTHIYIHTHTYIHIRTYIYIYIHLFTHTRIHIRVHTCTRKHKYTSTHTKKNKASVLQYTSISLLAYFILSYTVSLKSFSSYLF